jgi:hypothetical protein
MAEIVTNSGVGSALIGVLMSGDIQPGSDPGYQVCKDIYLYHPLGAKMVDGPVKMAMSQKRKISIPNSPEDQIKKAFEREWQRMRCDNYIASLMTQARVYGVGSIVYGSPDFPTNVPIDPWAIQYINDMYFSVLDPQNTAGSLVLNQDPASVDFQKVQAIAAAGKAYHPSRSAVVMNERPIYLGYTSSAFGYVGRSVYQRALFPLKSYVMTMIANDEVANKAALLIQKIKQPGSIADKIMTKASALKRTLLLQGKNGNVLSMSPEESVESIDLHHVNECLNDSRKNILEDIASANDMPAIFLKNETFAQGFGEGSEDAKQVARYIDSIRESMEPAYAFFDKIVMHKAWSEEFYQSIQTLYPDYAKKPYKTAFLEWANSFHVEWPNLLTEPDSEKVKVEKEKFAAIKEILELVLPMCDGENAADAIEWAANNLNENKILFSSPLVLDYNALAMNIEQKAILQQQMLDQRSEQENVDL